MKNFEFVSREPIFVEFYETVRVHFWNFVEFFKIFEEAYAQTCPPPSNSGYARLKLI